LDKTNESRDKKLKKEFGCSIRRNMLDFDD